MISAGELASMRRTVESTFVHTYTRTPRVTTADNPGTPTVDEGDDAWGEQVFTPGTPQPARPCKYKEKSTAVVTPNGLQNLNVPTLWVPSTDAVSPGDTVSHVLDAYGNVLLDGPAEVEDVSPSGLIAGGALHLEATLRQPVNI